MIIMRPGSPATQVAEIKVDNKTQLKQRLMGENRIEAVFSLDSFIDFQLGDYVLWGGTSYEIKKAPQAKKSKANQFDYNLEFFGPEYDLGTTMMLLDGVTDYSLNGKPETFLSHIVNNLNRVFGTNVYSVGSFPDGTFRTITFQEITALDALTKVAEEYDLEFSFSANGKTISLAQSTGNVTNLVFQFKQGLRDIERQELSDRRLVTRLYAYGGERNIDITSYGYRRLRISPMEKNIAQFGTNEGSAIFEDIYPRRQAVITGVDGSDETLFYDSNMDFDVNDQLISKPAKITFNTGLLAGYEFELQSYDAGSYEFKIIPLTDEQNQTLPNSIRKPQAGDSYVIHDILMPQTYIDNAESELQTRAQEYLDKYSVPNVTYTITPDPTYFRENLIELRAGDIIEIQDTDFGLNVTTRIIELNQSLADPYQYSIRVGSEVVVGFVTRTQNEITGTNDTLYREKFSNQLRNERLRRSYENLSQLPDLIFDPTDGYFRDENFRPSSISTLNLTVGAKPLAMNFNGLEIELNYLSDQNGVRISESQLVHFTIEETIRNWVIPAASYTIPDNGFRYLYVQCSRTTSSGSWLFSTNQIKVDNNPSSYTFLVGIIHAPINGVRGISQLYGQTFINGRFITTGRIQSVDQANYMDLDSNQFSLGDSNSGIDWNVSNPDTLTIRGSVVQRPSGFIGPTPLFRGDYNPNTTYYEGDVVYENGTSYIRIGQGSTQGVHPTNTNNWKIFANQGDQGPQGDPGPTGEIGPQGAAGADGIDGIDGKSAIGSIEIDISPAQFGGKGDFTFTLDAQEGGSTNTGEVRVQVTRFIKPDGTLINFSAQYQDNTVYTPYGEGAIGKFYLMYSEELVSSRFPSLSFSDNNYFVPVRPKDSNTWEAFDNAGNDTDVTLLPTDVFLCVIEASGLNSGLTGYVGFVNGAEGLDGEDGPVGPIGPQGPAGADGIDGVDGLNGEDGSDGFGSIPYPVNPATIGGYSDADILLDASSETASNTGEVFVRMKKLVDSKQNVKVNSLYRQTINTPFGEGTSGIFYLLWSDEEWTSRMGQSPALFQPGNIAPVIWDGSSWKIHGNGNTETYNLTLRSSDVFLCAVEAKNTTGGLTGFLSFLSGAKGQDAIQAGYFYDDFTEYEDLIDFWASWEFNAGTESALKLYSGGYAIVGGQSIIIGNNSGNDQVWATSKKRLAYDPEDLYQITFKVVRDSGGGSCYLGVAGFDANGNFVNANGDNIFSSQYYVAAQAEQPSIGAQTTYIGYFQGIAASGNGGEHQSPEDPATLHQDVKYIAPMFLANYNNNSGIFLIHSIEIKKVNDFSPIPRGTWNSAITYPRGSVVNRYGSSYIAKRETFNDDPALSPNDWTLIAQKGDTGPTGPQGPAGSDGQDGDTGPSIVFRGDFTTWSTTPFFNNSLRRDVIKYGSSYLIYKGPDGSTNFSYISGYWENFGGTFQSVATDLLLAENANIGNWIIKSSKISSQNTYGGVNKMVMDGSSGIITVTDGVTVYTSSGGSVTRTSTMKFDGDNGQITAEVDMIGTQPNQFVRMSGLGFRADWAGETKNNGVSTIKAAYMADVSGNLSPSAYSSLSAVVGVFGRATNTYGSNGAPSYGGYFHGLYATEFTGHLSRNNGSVSITEQMIHICTATGGSVNIYLPNPKNIGRIVIVVRSEGGGVFVQGNGSTINYNGSKTSSRGIGSVGEAMMFIWDGVYWQALGMYK
jgi:hypothetical protein